MTIKELSTTEKRRKLVSVADYKSHNTFLITPDNGYVVTYGGYLFESLKCFNEIMKTSSIKVTPKTVTKIFTPHHNMTKENVLFCQKYKGHSYHGLGFDVVGLTLYNGKCNKIIRSIDDGLLIDEFRRAFEEETENVARNCGT